MCYFSITLDSLKPFRGHKGTRGYSGLYIALCSHSSYLEHVATLLHLTIVNYFNNYNNWH
jgi:hypothetical protein